MVNDAAKLTEQNAQITQTKKDAILQAYEQTGVLTEACKMVGVLRRTVYQWIHNDPEFNAAYKAAKWMSAEPLIKEAERRGLEGVDRPLSHQGKLTGDTVKEYSDNLLMFTIKGKREEYREGSTVTVNNLQIEALNTFKQALALSNMVPPNQVSSTENHEEADDYEDREIDTTLEYGQLVD